MTPWTRNPFNARPHVVRSLRERIPKTARGTSGHGQARGRTAVLAGVVLFLAAQAGLNVAIRNDWLPVRDPVYAEKTDLLRRHNGFYATPTDAAQPLRFLALGSSRTQLGFDAARFADHFGGRVEAFNFGCPGAGPLTEALYLRRLLAAGVRPDFVLIEVHPCCLDALDPPFETRWLHKFRLRPGEPELLRSLGWDVPTPEHFGPRGYLTAASAFRFAFLNCYAPVLLPCPYGLTVGARSDAHGYLPGLDMKPAEKPRALERTYKQYAQALDGYHVGEPGCAAVRDMLGLCAERGIRAAVVLMPESSAFRGWYGPAGYAEVTAHAQRLTADFGVRLYDAREWVPDGGFVDGHHMIPAGANTFTDRLAKEWGEGQGAWGKRTEP